LRTIAGSVVRADVERDIMLGEVILIGDEHLLAEVVELEGHVATLQVYEETSGLASGAPVFATGQLFVVELGPGLLGSVVDGIQRPLPRLAQAEGNFLGRGQQAPALDRNRLWEFMPVAEAGARSPAAL
jgi:V/A-type H+-transporting ATPase subunit A